MTTINYAAMTGPELVAAFNAMLETPEGKQAMANRPTLKPVQRFADQKTAVARVESLASSIRAIAGARKADDKSSETSLKKKKGRTPKGEKTNRQKFKEALLQKIGTPISVPDLLQTVYGSKDEKFKGALSMVVKGFQNVNVKKDEDLKGFKFEKVKDHDTKPPTIKYMLSAKS